MVKRVAKKAKQAARITLGAAVNPIGTKRDLRFAYDRHSVNRKRKNVYHKWFTEYEKSVSNIDEQRVEISKFKLKPLISIILPIYNTNELHLKQCIQSVIDQSYQNWELCVSDDASTTDVLRVVKKLEKTHKNIKSTRLANNQHIAGSSNEALKLAKGEFIALLDHDDLLLPNALFEMVKAINQNPTSDLFYSDEDKVEDKEGHTEPFFKPDWSPDFLKSCNYITHFAVLRRSVVDKIGGFRIGTEGAQDWDLFLRFIEQTKRVVHVPKILYSWRKSITSTASNASSKPYAYINQGRVLRDFVAREKDNASVLASHFMGFWNIKYHPENTNLVSIVIPTKNNLEYIKRCLESIIERTTYPYFEVIVVDTGSDKKEVQDFYKSRFITSNPIKVVNLHTKPFNFSSACNFGASKAKGDYLVFLNNDTEVITEEWIEGMLGHAQRKDVGMVGCKLLFPNKHIQHAGVVLSERDIAFHPFYNQNERLDIFTNIYFSNIRNCAAVTAACSMIEKKKFDKVGGFDTELRVTYNDVDLCLRLLDSGLVNVYTPYSKLYHYESISVGRIEKSERDQSEVKEASDLMRKRWGKYLKNDPYYNPNFTQHGPGYDII